MLKNETLITQMEKKAANALEMAAQALEKGKTQEKTPQTAKQVISRKSSKKIYIYNTFLYIQKKEYKMNSDGWESY